MKKKDCSTSMWIFKEIGWKMKEILRNRNGLKSSWKSWFTPRIFPCPYGLTCNCRLHACVLIRDSHLHTKNWRKMDTRKNICKPWLLSSISSSSVLYKVFQHKQKQTADWNTSELTQSVGNVIRECVNIQTVPLSLLLHFSYYY